MYGQYSNDWHAGRRYRVQEQIDGACVMGAETVKRVGHNRVWFRRYDGSEGYILHLTVVAEKRGNTVSLNHGGYFTVTTRRAMMQALNLWGINVSIYAEATPGATRLVGAGYDTHFGNKCTITIEPETKP